jgi:2,3,4,5-tetrahydropyridine-2-carboxylate N-succinyltransferase
MKKEEIILKIDELFNHISSQNFTLKKEEKSFLEKVINKIDAGELRSAEKIDGKWIVNDFIKKAILLFIKTSKTSSISLDFDNYLSDEGTSIYYSANNISTRVANLHNSYGMKYYDKIPLKFAHFCEEDFKTAKFRVVPGCVVRIGAYIAKGVVLMPSFVNIGAYIGENTMIDTWSSVGSCAQIGKNCHISGGVGIGGVLEPASAMPVIIEDNVFIGARSEIAEGVIIEEGSVISMGVYIAASTKIVDRETGNVFYGRVPAGSVVVAGSMPSSNGTNLYAAIIVKKVDSKTRSKTSINELLRY